jgi:hypothetical protein
VHERDAAAGRHQLVALVERAVLELRDALPRARARRAHGQDGRLGADGVAVHQRARERDLPEPQVGDRRPQRQLVDAEADQQRQREHAVDQPLAEVRLRRERRVEMQRLRVHGHHREEGVVGLGDRAGHRVMDDHALVELLEPQARPGGGGRVHTGNAP